MVSGMNALPTAVRGTISSAAHSTGRQRRDSNRPSGNTSGSTKAVRQTAGAKLHVLIQRNAVPKGSDPGECTSV
jgi:hypothetical protein